MKTIVVSEFRHAGVIYSSGEPPPPELSAGEIEDLRAAGLVCFYGESRDDASEPLLLGTDLEVLVRLNAERPTRQVLHRLLATSQLAKRSPMLCEALALACGEPVQSCP